MELEESGIREECGVFGCIASGDWPTQLDVPHVITLGLVGLQHRGQESAGIVTSDGSSVPKFRVHKVSLNIRNPGARAGVEAGHDGRIIKARA